MQSTQNEKSIKSQITPLFDECTKFTPPQVVVSDNSIPKWRTIFSRRVSALSGDSSGHNM